MEDEIRNGTGVAYKKFLWRWKIVALCSSLPHTMLLQAMFWTTCPIMPLAHKLAENKILPLKQGQIKERDLKPWRGSSCHWNLPLDYHLNTHLTFSGMAPSFCGIGLFVNHIKGLGTYSLMWWYVYDVTDLVTVYAYSPVLIELTNRKCS